MSGQKFYYLRNAAALLELALVNYAMTKVVARGFTPIMTPDLVKESVLEKCGFQPRGTNTQVGVGSLRRLSGSFGIVMQQWCATTVLQRIPAASSPAPNLLCV